jgi:cytoskeleton protein RodZ
LTEAAGLGVGSALAEARKALGLSHHDVAQQIKFMPRQLEALEAERFEALPGPTIARGMVRTYARFLKLEPDPLLERMAGHVEAPDATPQLAARFSQPVPFSDGGRRSTVWYLALSAGVLLLAGGFLYEWRHERPLAPFVSPVKQEMQVAEAKKAQAKKVDAKKVEAKKAEARKAEAKAEQPAVAEKPAAAEKPLLAEKPVAPAKPKPPVANRPRRRWPRRRWPRRQSPRPIPCRSRRRAPTGCSFALTRRRGWKSRTARDGCWCRPCSPAARSAWCSAPRHAAWWSATLRA